VPAAADLFRCDFPETMAELGLLDGVNLAGKSHINLIDTGHSMATTLMACR
jgi:hypothetical protein